MAAYRAIDPYCVRRNPSAPARMAVDTSLICAGPSGLLITHPTIQRAMTKESPVIKKTSIMMN